MPDNNKQYTVYVDGMSKPQVYDEESFNRGKDYFFKDNPNAKVIETSAYDNNSEVNNDDFYTVFVEGMSKPMMMDAATFAKGKDKFLQDNPNAQITRGKQVNYWGDKLNDISTRIDALENELKGIPDEERHLGVNISDADALDVITDTPERRRRNQINAELDQLRRERESNPAWQTYWDKTKEELRGSIKQTEEDADISKGVSVKNEKGEYGFRQFGSSMESDYFKTAKQLYKDALKTAEAPSKYDDSLGIVNFAKGAAENIGSAVTMLELAKAMKMTNVIGTVKQIQEAEGENVNLLDLVENQPERLSYLSPGQREMMKAFIKRTEIERDRAGDMSIGYKAGAGAIQSLGFMGDFLLTGGAGSAAGKAVAKKIAKETVEDIAGKTLTESAKKMLVGNIEGAVKSLVMTPLMPSSYSNFLNSLTQLNSQGGMDLSGKAVLNSIGDTLIETFSENAGELFGIPFEGKLFDTLSKSKLGEVGKAMGRTGAGRLLKEAGWHGMAGEMAEEVLGNAMRTVTGIDENALKDFFSKDELLTTLASFAPMTIIGAGASMHQVRKAGKNMASDGEKLQNMLRSYELDEDQIKNLIDVSGYETPEQLGSAIARIGKAAYDAGKITKENAQEFGTALGNYVMSASKYKVLQGVFDSAQDAARAQNTALIDGEVGDSNWYHQGEEGNYVRTITDADGNQRFVVSSADGQLALVGRDGSKSFLTNEELEAGIADGSLTDSGEQPINDYLDGITEQEQKTAEEQRMTEETATQLSAIQERIAADPTINMGTEEAPKMGVVDAVNANGVHVTWQDEDGAKDATLTWEQVGNYLGTPVETKTDEQIEQEEIQAEEDIRSRKEDYNKTIPEGTEFTAVLVEGEEPVTYQFKRAFLNEDGTMMLQVVDKATGKDEQITEDMALQGNLTSVLDSFKTPAEVQQEEAVAEEETPADDGILRDFRGNPIPLKDDGSVNQTALWNADPEAWAKWNDSQRNDGGVNSRGYIAKATKKLQADAKAVQKQIAKELDFDKIENLEGQLASINSRIADLERIENNYANAEVAQAEAVQTPEEVPAPKAETTEAAPVAEAAQTQEDAVPQTPEQVLDSRLAEAKTPEEKRQALEEYYALTTTDPTVVGTRADILQRMAELGFSERVIGQVRDQLNDKGELTEGFHIGSMVFIVADDIRDARRARLAHLHEHWHEVNRVQGHHRVVADIPGVTTEYLLDVANKMAGITKGEGYSNYLNYPNPQQALADEVIALSMEVVAESTPENVDENLRNAGLDNQEIINFVKTIYNGERGNDQTLDSSGRDTLSGDNAQEGERQDGGDSASQPEGILGEQGSGSEERSIQGAGEGGLDTSGNPEVTPPLAPFVKEGDKLTSYIDAPTGQKSPSAPDETMFSLKREEDSKDDEGKTVPGLRTLADGFLAKLADKPLTPEELAIGSDAIGEMVNYMMPYLDMVKDGKRYLPEEIFGKGWSTIFKNGSYGRTMENTLICMRTLAYNDFVNAVQEKVGRPLTPTESFLASQMLYDIATDPQCLYCYVALDRKAYNGFLKTYIEQRDAVLDKYKADDSIDKTYRLPAQAKSRKNRKALSADNQVNKLYLEYLDGRADTPSMRNRFNGWLDRIAEGTLIGMKDLTSPEARQKVAGKGASYAAQIDDAEKYAQSASWAKKQEEYRAYNGELLSMPQKVVDFLNSEYGLRFYSFSEYSPAFIVENMQMVRDAALRGLVGLAYTKEIDFAKIFAPTGININISCYGREAEDGTVVMDTKQGADWGEAQALREKYGNVGCVFVATNDRMVEWAIHQPWIDVVIPFHIVRTGEDIAKFYDWTNYTAMEADKDVKGGSRDIMPTEHMNDKDTFLHLCEERGLKPRFADLILPSTGRSVTEDPDYMKLVNETRRSVNETVRIKPIFDTQEAKRSFDEFVDKGGYYAGWFTEEGAFERGVEQVAADVEAGKTAKDVDYGRQDIKASAEKLAAMAGKKKRPRSHQGTPRRIGGDKITKAQQNVLNYLETGEFKSEREPLEVANASQKQPVSDAVQPVVTEEDVMDVAMFRLSKNNKATVESWLKKREDINDEQRAEVVDFIDKLDDAKTQLATAKWFANGTIRIPEDMKKVQQAISVAGKAKVDPLRYNSPMELLDAHAEFKPSEERINPDEVSTLHRAAEYPEGIVVYDVDNTKESRENMRKIINTHFGEDASPWCLLQGDGKGNLTADSARYWRHYNAYPKQVAFKDGKLLAFSANDKKTRLWWDRKDESHYGIPITQKVEGDELGRSANYIIEDGQLVKEPGSHLFRGNRQNGVYEEWSTDGSTLLERTNYKNGEEDGLTEAWYPNGQMQRRTTMKNGNYAGRYEAWFDNGQKQVDMTLTEEGFNDGERRAWWKNGNPRSEGRYKNSKRVGEHKLWDEDGDLESVQYYDENGEKLGFEEHGHWGLERKVTFLDDGGQEEQKFSRRGLTMSVERTNGKGRLNGLQEQNFIDGTPQVRANYSNGVLDGIREVYFTNGKLQLRGGYKNGMREGIHEMWDRDGSLVFRNEYHNDEKVRELPLDENVQFRLSNMQEMDQEFEAAYNNNDEDTAQRMVDEMAEAAGYTIRGYHGTTHDFTIFDRSRGNAEGNWGKGFYFTNNEDDAEANYAGEGPDLTNRIELLAENMEWMDGYEDMDYEQRLEEARKQLAGDNPHVISAAIKMENPVVFDSRGGQQETYFDYNENYNEETEEYEGEPTGKLVDFVEAWNDVLSEWEWEGNNVSPDEILEYANYEGLTATQLEDKAREILAYVENSEGQVATGEFLRQVFERMGFDGIVDNNVNQKFGSQRRYGRGMDGVDYGTTHVIAFQPNQIKQADPFTFDDEGKLIPLSKRFDSWNDDIRFRKANQTQNGFISNAQMALDKIKMDKATPEQWVKMLEKEGGMKAGEDKWLGLSDWLKASDKKTLTKEEVSDFIEQNRIQIEEVRYSEEANKYEEEEGREAFEELNEEFHDLARDWRNGEVSGSYNWNSAENYAFEQMVDKYGEDFRQAFEINGSDLMPYDTWRWEGYTDATRKYLGIKHGEENAINNTRLNLTTLGLQNKREIALTVPTIEPYKGSLPEIHFVDQYTEGRAIAWIRFGDTNWYEKVEDPISDGLTPDEEEELNRLKKVVSDLNFAIQDARNQEEWDAVESNLEEAIAKRDAFIAEHLPKKTPIPKRVEQKVLVLDEVQSQRHQDAREKGYKKELTDAEKEEIENAGKEYKALTDPMKEKYGVGIVNPGNFMGWPEVTEEDRETMKRAEAIRQRVEDLRTNQREGIPAAPFEKNWHELAMKRMLRLAAEEGYDKIAWTTGDQQAERYNLGGVVNKIESTPYKSEGYNVDIVLNKGDVLLFNTDKEGTILSDNSREDQYVGKNLSDVVGKDIAKRILDSTEEQTISGDGLRVGGEGMKGFYDDILPRFMNKYGKKWGVKVQDIELPELLDETGNHLVMHSVDVTPEMKESVMEGQVMFSKRKKKASEIASVTPNKAHQPTVISNADVANIVKNLDTLATSLKNLSNQTKTFIGDVANALNARQYGSKSQYATFKTANGKTVTIRLSDHNAHTSGFDYKGRKEGISIVISAKKNQGITNDGQAHIVEYFYDAIKLRRAEGKPLKDIVRAIQQVLYSGEFKDSTGLAERQEVNNPKDKEGDNILFSLRGIIGAENAEDEAALDNLEVAEEMENAGKDSPVIWKATGWERGADGKWRNEIPDAKQKEGVSLQKHNIAGEILDAPELFDSYPELAEMPIDLVNSAAAGAYNREQKRITLDTDYNTTFELSKEDKKKVEDSTIDFIRNGIWKRQSDIVKFKNGLSEQYGKLVLNSNGIATLLHELQHAIQQIEGFAKGTNEKLGERLYYKEALKTKPEETYFAWFLSRNNSAKKLNQIGRERVIRYAEIYDKSRLVDEDLAYLNKLIDYLKGISDDEYKKLVSRAAKIVKAAEKAGEVNYEKSAGEVEARNVERRSTLSDEKRQKYSPEATEEYSRSEQIVQFRKVTDPATLERLESEEKIPVYASKQFIEDPNGDAEYDFGDGRGAVKGFLVAPMSGKVEGKWRDPERLGDFQEAEERPDLVNEKGEFILDKGNGDTLKVAYAPYNHLRRSPLNEQFSSAYKRPNLVIVKGEIPASELTSGYTAEKSKKSTGEHDWPSGKVSNALAKKGQDTRKVILSRWFKPIEVVPASKVADEIVKKIDDAGIKVSFNYNVVTPTLRRELVKRGVKFSGWQGKKPDDWKEQVQRMQEENNDIVLFRRSQDLFNESREGGLTGLIGDQDASELYRNVYRAIPKEIRERIVNKAGDGFLFSEATRDAIAEAVENGDPTGLAGLASNMLRDYVGPLDERTARYILWRGDRKAEDDDLLDTVKDITMQRRLQVGQFADPAMFRLSDNLEEAENRAESMADDAQQTKDEKKEFAKVNDALTTIKAMSLQKEYDRKTVNTITVLAKNVLKDQSIETLSRHEIARLLGIITTSIGKAPKTVKKNADALVGLIVDHLLRSEETKLGMLANTKASKTNQAGVEVQGALDVRGQNVLKAYKAGLDMDLENPEDEFDGNTIKGRLNTLSDRLSSEDDAVRSEAEDEYAGLMLAQEYQEKIKASVNEERGLKNEMKEAAEAYRDGNMSRTSYNQFVEEAEKSVRENKIERIEAYRDLRLKMLQMMEGSIDARKEFTEREKQRVEEIHHLANSDMQGEDASPFKEPTRMGRFANSSIVRFFSKPLITFDQMLRLFGQKNVAGEGYLFNKFHRGWIDATEKAYLGDKQAKEELDAKVSEVFDKKMRWSDLYAEERKMPTVKVKWWDGGQMKEHELTQGNLLYIYMVNKMTDGRMKLRRMGITDEHVDAIKKQMDERFIELADWLQGEYLVNKRNKYNAVHERLFGASMAAIEDYFPLKINKRSLNRAEDIGRPEFDDALPATTTGSIIKRKRNAQDLDLLGADAFSVVIEHIEQMEQWAAFAEFNKDLNTLLSYKRFRNQVQNMDSVYGSGNELWKNFKSVCRIAGGTYNPAGKKSDLDTAALNIAKGVTSAKISFRIYTALKQFLSMPAFVSDANPKYLAENLATPWKAWNWAMENLPMYEKRWKSRMVGDTRLMNTESDWKLWRNKIVETLSRLGMSPNAFVDAMTIAIGSHSMYQTRYDRYIQDGYTEEQADKKAKQDATTLYNETQQSNEAAFVSPVQLDRTVLATMLTVFRNSSMGYQRQLHDAIRNIGKMMKPGYKAASIEFMTKQMVRDGLTEEQAEHAANRNYEREKWRSAARVATFGFLVQFAWNLGGSIAYLLFGDDDDKKEEMLTEALIHGLIGGSMEGLAGGNVMSEALNMVAKGESLNNYDPSLLPIISDMKSAYKKMSYNPVAGSYDILSLLIQSGFGVNPQTLSDAVVAVVDACGGDLDTATEAMMLFMRVLQVPQSQVDQIYIDELGMNADKARSMSPGEMAERYARYKINKEAGPLVWAYSDEAEEKREKAYLKRFKTLVKERKESK